MESHSKQIQAKQSQIESDQNEMIQKMTAKKDGALQSAIGKIGQMVDNSVKVDLADEDVEMKNEIKVLDYQDEDENAMVDTEPTSPQNKVKDVVDAEICCVEKQSC